MLSYPICYIYRTWKSIHIAWGEISKLLYGGGEGGGEGKPKRDGIIFMGEGDLSRHHVKILISQL